jgi:hypothetical protein
VECSVYCPSPLNTYSYVREEDLGSTRNSKESYLLFTCIANLGNSCNTHADHEWAGGTFLRQRKKVPSAHAQQVYLEKHSEGIPHWINLFVCLSVHLSIRNTKTHSFLMWELKLGCPRGVFCPSSIPSEYLFLCARRKFGLNKKIRRNILIVYVYYQPR